MIRVALRGVREHLVRFSLSVLAVTLGVAFVVGTFAFRGMLSSTFDAIITTSVNADVYVHGADEVTADLTHPGTGPTSTAGFGPQRNPVPATLADDVASVDGVQRAVPDFSGPVVLVGADGTAVVTSGPPSLGFAIDPEYPTAHLTEGAWPADGQIVLETGAVEASGLRTGDVTTVVLGDAPREVTVSGTFAIDASAAGAVLVGFDTATAQAAFAPDGLVAQISVYADPGVKESALAARVAAALPASADAQAVTGAQVRAQARESIQEVLGFLQTFLLIFAAIALVVGAFIIANAFAMAVRERQRENALLRAIGASPAQVFATVLAQALAVGLVGAALGVGGGVLLVHAIRAVLARFGMALGGDVPLSGGQVALAVALGTVLCLVAAALPARRAALVPPVQAMREDVAPERGTGRRALVGAALAVVGAGTLALASRLGSALDAAVTGWAWLDGANPRVVLGVGAGLLLLGVLVGSPAMARWVLRALGAPAAFALKPLGGLARGNVTRNPRRTAATAGALLIGMALVACTGVIAASTEASVATVVHTELRAPLLVDSATLQLPTGAVDAVRAVPGVGRLDVVRLGSTGAAVGDGDAQAVELAGVSDAFFRSALRVEPLQGDPSAALADGEAAVARRTARTLGLQVGDQVRLGLGAGTTAVRVGAVFDSQVVAVGVVVRDDVFDGVIPAAQARVRAAYVTPADGTDVPTLRTDLREAVTPFLVLTVRDRDETASAVADQVDQAIAILYALLALSIVIALLGIVNTLALSVIERTREIGLLRAVGLGRLQLAGVIALESVLIAVYGTVLGVATGIAVSAALPGVLADEGLSRLAVPWGQVLAVLGVAVVIGLVASVGPALRAARLPVLEAVTVE
ncbi:ABC transporter permease [Xylanimonas ulmi]|uniref:Putative ABC transport system permease protein n=1 Tax=Xylanimonas ulmi TaxID=228973 RepID=A0A4Q7M4P0_9MICO|nr:FtsX-like permease family protein [Xylanibacterium ulmi]RZS62935.1 putative ABC transport system permease protein [Xylanibacterium ulmi]